MRGEIDQVEVRRVNGRDLDAESRQMAGRLIGEVDVVRDERDSEVRIKRQSEVSLAIPCAFGPPQVRL